MKELKKSYKRFPVNLDIIRLDIGLFITFEADLGLNVGSEGPVF